MINSSILLLIVNFLFYLVAFIVYQSKTKKFTVISALLIFYGISAAVAVHLFDNPLNIRKYNDITLFPFIYLFAMLFLVAAPLLKIQKINYKSIQPPSPIAYNVLCVIVIGVMLSSATYTFSHFRETLTEMLLNDDIASDIYGDVLYNAQNMGRGISNIWSIFRGLVSDLTIFLLMYQLTRSKQNYLITAGLVLSVLVTPMTSINLASRGALVNYILVLFMWYIFMRKWMSPKVNKIFTISSLSLLSVFVLAFVLITNSRFSSRESDDQAVLYSLESYYGQAFLNFDNYGLDAGGIRYGDRTMTGLKALFVGMDNVPKNFVESVLKHKSLKIHETSFYTFVGDFTIDFGPEIAAIIFILFAYLFCKQFDYDSSEIPIHKLIIVYFIVSLLGKGLSLFPYSSIAGNLRMLVFILVYVYFRVDYRLLYEK